MREYRLRLHKQRISKFRYCELRAVFKQYRELKHEANSMLGIQGRGFDETGVKGAISSSVETQAIRREAALKRIAQIDESIRRAVDGDSFYIPFLTLHLCDGRSFESLKADVPYLAQRKFFQYRIRAFVALDLLRQHF